MTIRQIASLLKEPPRRVRHYIRALVDAGLVVVEEERPRRGTIERTYRGLKIPLLWENGWPGELSPTDMKMVLLDTLRLVFDAVTDAPVSRFVLELKGGKNYGLLINSENLCKKPQHAIARFTAQNGLVDQTKPLVENQCGERSKGKKR